MTKHLKRLLFVPILLSCALTPSQVLYHVTDLGTLGGTNCFPKAINSKGEVTGLAFTSHGDEHAFFYSPAGLRDIGTLGGASSAGICMNQSGQIAGLSSFTSNPQTPDHAFLYTNGVMQDIGTLGGVASNAGGINDAGQIVGQSSLAGNDNVFHAFIFQSNQMTDIGTLGGISSTAFSVNNSGAVVGGSDTSGGSSYHAFLYTNGDMQDLGTLSGYSGSVACSINDSEQIAGSCGGPNNTSVAFLYSDGMMQNLGVLDGFVTSTAEGMNDLAQVVGYCELYEYSNQTAFLYSGGVMLNINNLFDGSGSGAYMEDAVGINDSGLIVGYGKTSSTGTAQRGLLLTPVAPNVVLPDSYSLLEGAQSDGSLYSIQFNDSWYLTVLSGFPALLSQPPVQVQLSGTSPTLNPSSFQFTFTGHVNSINLSQSILLYNFQTSAYETLSTTAAHSGSDQTVTVTASGDLTRFVNQSTGEVRTQVNFNRTGAPSVLRWTASLGDANWIIQ